MDDTIFPPAQSAASQPPSVFPVTTGNVSQAPQSGTQPVGVSQNPSTQAAAPAPTTPSVPQQPQQEASTPRITLDDLYGPSTPEDRQVVQTPLPPQPIQPTDQQIPVQQSTPEIAPVESPVQQVVQTPQIPEPEIMRVPVSEAPIQQDVLQPKSSAQKSVMHENIDQEDAASGGSGFGISKIIKPLIIGVGALILLFLIWGVISLIASNKNIGSGKVTLTYWGLWESPNVMQSIVTEFEKAHPNITVQYTQEDPKDYVRRLLTRVQQGDGPDMFRFHNSWAYPLQSILLPLPTSVVMSQDLSSTYPPVVSQDLVANGALYGLPLEMDVLSLFVNTDIFTHAGASVPTTWDTFVTTAKALTVKDPQGHIQTSGAALGTYENISHAPDIVSLLMLQNGANLQKLSGSENATDALSFYTSFAQPDGNVWDSTLDNSLLAFSRGKVAMYFGYSYDIFAIQAANPTFKFAVYPVPHLPGRNNTLASYWAEGVSNRSKNQKEALEFMQFLAQKDTQTQIYTEEAKTRAFGELYARLDLAQGLKGNSLLAPFISQFPQAKSSFFVDNTDYAEYNGSLDQYLGNAIDSILKDTSVDSASSTLAQGVAQVTSQYAQKTQ